MVYKAQPSTILILYTYMFVHFFYYYQNYSVQKRFLQWRQKYLGFPFVHPVTTNPTKLIHRDVNVKSWSDKVLIRYSSSPEDIIQYIHQRDKFLNVHNASKSFLNQKLK
ncbi:UNVERIFIED_CONTAM: hypothetical protein K2H54_030629 [Gekko kuhli]